MEENKVVEYVEVDINALAKELAIGAFALETASVPHNTIYDEHGKLVDKVSKELLAKLEHQYKRYIQQYQRK